MQILSRVINLSMEIYLKLLLSREAEIRFWPQKRKLQFEPSASATTRSGWRDSNVKEESSSLKSSTQIVL